MLVSFRRFKYAALAFLPLVFFQNCDSFTASHQRIVAADLSSEGSGTRFESARRVIERRCTACHYAGAAGGNLLFDTEAEYLRAKLVSPGSISTSRLITRLRNYPGQVDGRNMPPSGPIPNDDYAALTAWVSAIPITAAEGFTCAPDEAPAALDARRLSKKEMFNSLRQVLARPFGATEADQILGAARFNERIPNDSRRPFGRSDRAVESDHAEAYFALAEELATAATTDARLPRLVSTFVNYAPAGCANPDVNAPSTTCRDAFLRNFLTRLWGRPPEADELAAYRTEFTSGQAQPFNNLVFRAFLSPQFLHHLYTDATPLAGRTTALTSYAVARRLSYHFRLAGPDEDLLQLAATTDLRTDANFAVALNRVSGSAAPMLEDFADDWLGLHRLPSLATPSTPKWARVAAGITVDQSLRSAMRQEIIDLVTYVYREGRPVQDLLTSNVAFARNPELMKVYGQTAAAPASFNEQSAVRLPAAERAGLATRAGYLSHAGDSERPVIRGVHVMADLLCTEVKGQIPAEAANAVVPSGLLTTREKYDQVTAGSSCIGCHAQINPIGNAFAQYNAFGGFQLNEPIFVDGVYRQDLATDARVSLRAALQDDVEVEGGVNFSRWMATSAPFRACLSRQYNAYAQRMSSLPTESESCDMTRMDEIVRANGSLGDFLRAPAVNTNFRRRDVGP